MIKEKQILRTMNIAFCLVVLPLVILLMPVERVLAHSMSSIALLFIYAIVIYALSKRFNWGLYLLRRQFFRATLSLLSTILVAFLFMLLRQKVSYPDHHTFQAVMESLYGRHLQMMGLLGLLSMCYGILTGIIVELFNNTSHRQELENERNKAQLALYKAQINPHFLFNTLNTLYALHLTQSKYLDAFILKLSSLVKYTYSHAESDMVRIGDEMSYLQDYIDLQCARLSSNGSIHFTQHLDDEEKLIPPMLLITFIENAFKYGVSSTEDYEIYIHIEQTSHQFIFTTHNTIHNRKKSSSGLGLENCRKRLELIYGDSFLLKNHEDGDQYHTYLSLSL